jgi:hypothetical protein
MVRAPHLLLLTTTRWCLPPICLQNIGTTICDWRKIGFVSFDGPCPVNASKRKQPVAKSANASRIFTSPLACRVGDSRQPRNIRHKNKKIGPMRPLLLDPRWNCGWRISESVGNPCWKNGRTRLIVQVLLPVHSHPKPRPSFCRGNLSIACGVVNYVPTKSHDATRQTGMTTRRRYQERRNPELLWWVTS